MNLQYRTGLLIQLGQYILSDNDAWLAIKEKASYENGWFVPAFIDLSVNNIGKEFLQKDILEKWTSSYNIPSENTYPKKIGIIMAGNIPLVGFHDLLSVFIAGHKAIIKPSSKDSVLIKHLVAKLIEWDNTVSEYIVFADMLKGCDAYIATGSNNSAGYFEYYFEKYPHIIRRNRTSVAFITGTETNEQLEALADDVFLYFGLGCRNVTKLYVPQEYDFVPLINAFKKYSYLADHHKFKNNYDYNLALHILNHTFYMSNEALLLIENESVFSPISQVNYQFYTDAGQTITALKENKDIQCIVGKDFIPFGNAQTPAISDYADGIDTLQFLTGL